MKETTHMVCRIALVAACIAVGCTPITEDNEPPVAKIMVTVAGLEAPTPIPFTGSTVSVMLSGAGSTDADGRIVDYLWLQTDVSSSTRYGIPVDGGVPPTFTGDPPPGMTTQVDFVGPGSAEYSLWVTDEDDAVSIPATVSIDVEVPSMFMPDAACAAAYGNDDAGCVECVCTPNAMMGCLDEYTACYDNPDPMFVTLCTAVIDCGLATGCKGSACYTGGCMTEIDAASTYMGGTLADCSMGDPATNPCAAATLLGACTNDTNCMNSCM